MLIEFTVGNYRSFKEPITFSMAAAKIVSKNKLVDQNNTFVIDPDTRLLKSAAIYGANASGKSNLVQAINFMSKFVLQSSTHTQVTELIDVEEFRLSAESIGKPSLFECVFIVDGKQYRYGFEADKNKVVSEWLFWVPSIREAKLFVRDLESIELSAAFKEGKGLFERTRKNALFLSVVAQFNGQIAQKILTWFKNLHVLWGINDMTYRPFTLENFNDNSYKQDIVQFIKRLDLGIDDIEIEIVDLTDKSLPSTLPEAIRSALLGLMEPKLIIIKTIHKKYDEDGNSSQEYFDIDHHESEGTKKLFSIAGPLIDTLRNGTILVVDELDARLHPLLTCSILDMFHSKEMNPHNAQIIFTTHDTNLLNSDIFRRDQIWFTEKDKMGFSSLYSLAEYKIRNDASFEKDYIKGKYGAIPFLGDVSRVIDDSDSGASYEQ
jgi:uncharacterized protein